MFPYSTFLNPLFWMAMGALFVFFILALKVWFRDHGVSMNAWKWLFVGLWLVCLHLVVAAGSTLLGENEVRAAMFFTGGFGLFLFISGVGLWRLLKTK